jgi:hypothetical protein
MFWNHFSCKKLIETGVIKMNDFLLLHMVMVKFTSIFIVAVVKLIINKLVTFNK